MKTAIEIICRLPEGTFFDMTIKEIRELKDWARHLAWTDRNFVDRVIDQRIAELDERA